MANTIYLYQAIHRKRWDVSLLPWFSMQGMGQNLPGNGGYGKMYTEGRLKRGVTAI
jgi:hypothetical protein